MNYIDILFGIAIGYLIGVVSGYTMAMFKLLKEELNKNKENDKEEKEK